MNSSNCSVNGRFSNARERGQLVTKKTFHVIEGSSASNDTATTTASAGTVAKTRRDSDFLHAVESAVQTDRASKIALLKQQVMNGTYRPNLDVVAERMLSDFGQ